MTPRGAGEANGATSVRVQSCRPRADTSASASAQSCRPRADTSASASARSVITITTSSVATVTTIATRSVATRDYDRDHELATVITSLVAATTSTVTATTRAVTATTNPASATGAGRARTGAVRRRRHGAGGTAVRRGPGAGASPPRARGRCWSRRCGARPAQPLPVLPDVPARPGAGRARQQVALGTRGTRGRALRPGEDAAGDRLRGPAARLSRGARPRAARAAARAHRVGPRASVPDLDETGKRAAQALYLTRGQPARRTRLDRLGADLAYRRARAGVDQATGRLRAAAASFREALARGTSHRQEVAAWSRTSSGSCSSWVTPGARCRPRARRRPRRSRRPRGRPPMTAPPAARRRAAVTAAGLGRRRTARRPAARRRAAVTAAGLGRRRTAAVATPCPPADRLLNPLLELDVALDEVEMLGAEGAQVAPLTPLGAVGLPQLPRWPAISA